MYLYLAVPVVTLFATVTLAGCHDGSRCRLGHEIGEGGDAPAPLEIIELNDNGAWSWFSDSRAIVHQDQLIVGSVRSLGDYESTQHLASWGNVEVSLLDLDTGETAAAVLDQHFEQDDHDSPALLPLAEGRLLAVYTRHAVEPTIYYRRSAPHDPLDWGEVRRFTSPGAPSSFAGDNVTYSNLFRWPGGRIYNFYRGFGHDPNYMYSDDEGRTWSYGGRLAAGDEGYAPYLRYAHDGAGTLHFIATEDHPRHRDTSIYHGYLREGVVYDSSGVALAELSETTAPSLHIRDLSRVYAGDADHVAWVVDIELDAEGRPYIVFSVQRDGAGLPFFTGGFDLRYHYGRWDGSAWSSEEIAHAGTRLYAREADYSGLAALDPKDPDLVYISTDAAPRTGAPLISEADCARHYELYRGTRRGPVGEPRSWDWEPLTANSTDDNLRPIVPRWDDERTALVWMRGRYIRAHGHWTTRVVAAILP